MRRLAAVVVIAVVGALGVGAAALLRDEDSKQRPKAVVQTTMSATTTYIETRADGSVWDCTAGAGFKLCTSDVGASP